MNAWLTAAEAALCEVAVKGGVLLALACVAVWALRGAEVAAFLDEIAAQSAEALVIAAGVEF